MEIDFFGSNARLHHIGVLTNSIESINKDLEILKDPIQNVGVAFINMAGITMELVEPSSSSSPVANSINRGIKIAHICFEVDSLNEAIERGRSFGFHKISPVNPAIAFNSRNIVWLFSRDWGLFELLERQK